MRNSMLAAALLLATSAAAQPLSIVNVQAPNVNFVFNPTGVVTVQDLTAPVWTSGFLQSRNFSGAAGAPAAGLYVYEYRVDLTNVVGITAIPSIFSISVDIGPNVPLDFNGDKKPDDVFVVTKGGLGTIGLMSATRSGNTVKFVFSSPVSGGASAGKGQTSFFFGFVSRYPRREVKASAPNNMGAPLLLKAWAPKHP